MTAKDTGAAERAHSMVQLLNGHSDVRESVEEVMQIIENDGLLAKDDTRFISYVEQIGSNPPQTGKIELGQFPRN
jgi:hypothetical protein